jgi:hypothetical protein
LPFGPNRLLLTNAPVLVQRLVERWQLGAIFTLTSGAPITIQTGINSPYGLTNNLADLIGPLPKNSGKVTKLPNGVVTYFDGLQQVADPGKASVTTAQGLQGANTNFAIADAQGRILLANPTPGQAGNLGQNWFEGPGFVGLNANLSKRIRISETKEFEIRVDAINVLNRPNFAGSNNFGTNSANLSINSTQFGRLALPGSVPPNGVGVQGANAGNRQFVFNGRVNF